MTPVDVILAVRDARLGFNFEFLVFFIICGLLTVFFLLYFNRLFASVVSYAIRTYTWHRYRVYIDIKAIQISLLAGRIFFTGLRYHGSNETFLVQHGEITWRYWLRRVRDADINVSNCSHGSSVSGSQKNSNLPCRIHARLVGVEWFVYNRSPAYNDLLNGLLSDDPSASKSSGISNATQEAGLTSRRGYQNGSAEKNKLAVDATAQAQQLSEKPSQPPPSSPPERSSTASQSLSETADGNDAGHSLPAMLQLLPIHVEFQKPAVVVGNDNTKAILIVKANSASTIVDAGPTNTVDPYRQLFKIEFDHPVIEMRENDEFKEDQVARATRRREDTSSLETPTQRSFFRNRRRKVFNSLRNMVPYLRRSVESFSADSRAAMSTGVSQIPGSGHWQGLSRYLDDRYQDDKARWSSVEYGAVNTILDSPSAALTVYWDSVSKITANARRHSSSSFHASINGTEPPAWGMSLSVKGGTVNYGPWADRQRADLQRVFYPTLSKNSTAAVPLTPGSWRVATQFNLFVELEDAVTLRIPTREESKNWRWHGKEPPVGRQAVTGKKRRNRNKKSSKGNAQPARPAGWLEIKVPSNSTVSYSMDMLGRSTGYQNRLDIDLPSTELRSSVNHDLMWKSGPQRISCDLSNPLTWNTLRSWSFNITCEEMKLYLLRDHIFLLIDLVDDWATGPPSEYLVFTPYIYHLKFNLNNLQLYLNVNDENIIDKATAHDDNTYLILSSPILKAASSIPLDKFRPSRNAIPFDIRTDTFDLTLHAPQSNTQAAFLSSNELGHGESLVVTGSYEYNATTSVANTDTLILDVHGQSPYAYLYGFIIRYLILLKDNYFGDFVHFRTLDEYQEQLQLEAQKSNTNTDAVHRPPNKKSNDLDVILSVRVDDPRILLPVNLYSASRYVQCELANLSVDLRFTNYYMDLELLLSPLSLSLGYASLSPGSPNSSYTNTQLFVDGVRVFGHRTFGLPPSEPTYLCNWDVSVGMVDGECTADFLTSLAKGGVAFGFMFDDVENALVPYSSLVFHDVTFVRVDIASVRLWLHVDEAAFLLSTGSIQVRSNDWGGTHYSKRANISIPNIEISCVNAESASRHTSRRNHPVDTAAYLKTDVQLASIGRKFHFQQELKIQQDLIRREDQRTGRTPFLFRKPVDPDFVPEPFDPPAQCVPPPAFPLTEVDDDDNASYQSIGTSRFSGRLRRQSSFLSSSSSNTSLRGPRSHPRSRARSRQTALSTQPSGTEKERRVSGQRGSVLSQEPRLAAIQQPSQDWQQKEHIEHSSVAFSSQYFAPHFPLGSVRPDGREATFEELEDESDNDFFGTDASLNDLDPNSLSDNHAQASTMIEFTTGITAFISPEAVRYVNSLLSALQPSEPDDILDSLQTSTIGDIFSEKKQSHITGSMQDILVKLPKANIRFLNSSTLDSPDASQEEQDQYDIRISKTLLITRTVKDRTGDNVTSRTSLHFRLKSAEMSASERLSSIETPQAAIMVNIDDVSVSLGAKDITYFDADIGSIVGSTASGKVEYLASLIHRTGSIASELGNLLSETASRNNNRTKYLVSQLLEDGHATNDPSFLIRPSAVLRSTHEHMRTVDSWKLMMRLRQIWATLSQSQRRELIDKCRDNPPEAHPDVADHVISLFQKWRSWDLDNPRNAVLMKKIFGKAIDEKEEPPQEYPLLGACQLAELQFVLDPGPKQNNIGFLDIALRVDKRPPGQPDVFSEMKDFDGSLTILNLCCAEAVIHLNWELCELAEDVLRLYNKAQPQPSEKTMSNKQPKRKVAQSSAAYHVVFEVVKGSIEAETVNLTVKSIGDGLKTSILLCNAGEELSVANAMLNSNAVMSKLQSHGKILGVLQIQKPSIFIAHELHKTIDIDAHVVKVSASSPNLTLRVKDDPIGLLEVLDLLIRDEAAQVYRLKGLIPSPPEGQKKRDKIKQRISTFVLNVAMFLDGYTISIPLLQSLTYKITGSVARASCAANFGKDIVFDFDIKENSHEMQINVKNEPRSISLLEIPPANGRITSNMQSTENVISVLASMEVIRLDASAIYSLLAALNRPQISGAIEEAQQQVKIIQGHVSETFGTQREMKAENASLPTSTPNSAYNIHLALAGLRILARTHLKTVEEPMAQILFALDKVTLQASNQQDSTSSPLKYPDLYVNLRQISLDICRGKENALRSCGNLTTGINISASSQRGDDGREDWSLHFRNDDLTLNLSPETVSTIVDVVGYMGSKIRDLDTSRELEYLRKLRQSRPKIRINDDEQDWGEETDIFESVLSSITYRFELRNIRFCWDVADGTIDLDYTKEDLVLSIKLIEFGTRTRKSARLTIEDFLLQTVPPGQDKAIRSLHSALLPEVMFNVAYVSTADARRMAFQAVGDSLDLRLTSAFIVPAANLIQSISLSMKNAQAASSQWTIEGPAAIEPLTSKKTEDLTPPRQSQRRMFGNKRLENLLVDADFAGAVVYVSTKRNAASAMSESKYSQPSLAGKYGQFSADDSGSGAVLRSPGLAWKAEYRDNGKEDPSLYGEIKINASSNILYPSVVPLVLDILSSVKKVVSDNDANADTEQKPEQLERPKLKQTKSGDEDNFLTADPSTVLGRLRLNLGLRICRQEFSLSCQPIARVSATACFDSMYFTLITVTSQEQGNFFAISGVIAKPQASVQHVYSRDSTASFELDSVAISFMNSKHFSGTSGVSAILNVSPMKVSVNAKQVQDFLLFREIWYPEELRQKSAVQVPKMPTETSQAHLVQRYQEVAATAAFPWTATISIAALDVCVDLGQSIGKSVFQINEFWVSSKKTSDWEQNLCLGFEKVGVDCTGRLSGFVALQDFRLRSSIQWPQREEALNETPLVQASLAFNALRVKAAFDYQAFLVADITSLEFLMYNVRDGRDGNGDRLVAIFDGEAVQVFGTTASVAQAVALYQALQKLIEERRENFKSSLREIEKFMKRKSISSRTILQTPPAVPKLPVDDTLSKSPISLDTDVVVTLKALNLGVFPSTFSDHQVFKMEALNAYARFAASIEQRKIHSILRMTLGQLRIGLAGVRDAEAPKMLNEMTVEDVVQRATGSRGGTILKVPRVEAVMETWQKPSSNHIDYIFKSAFEGKVEVGWNYSRISYIRGMWANHSKSLEQTWGRQLPMTAVKITGVPETEGEQQKITAEVNVPQSKYDYLALEPPVIETPQLRDMGEATPPLEWIGLHRDRLPNLTHQIVIVSLLELAGEVEDAYSRILGST